MREPTAPAYYDRRAREYDDWYLGTGLFAGRARDGWDDDVAALVATLTALPPARTLDVGCGTGFLTRHLRGDVTALDQSGEMLAVAADRLPGATVVRADGIDLPFPPDTFDRVVTGHFYGHLDAGQRATFLASARRVAPELVVVDAALRDPPIAAEWAERTLGDGSRWEVYKRYFDPDELLDELGGGDVLHAGPWFVAVRSPRR